MVGNSIIYYCDSCGARFTVVDIEVKDRILDKKRGVRQSYFNCPKCGAEFTVLVSDPEVAAMVAAGNQRDARIRSQMLREIYLGGGRK